jgi:hypothetical protein
MLALAGVIAMADGPRNYSFDQLHDRAWQITPAAWVIAKSSAPELASADLEDIQMLPSDPDGATIMLKIKTANHGSMIIRGEVLANGDFVLSQPKNMESFGSIFDDQADKGLASVIKRTSSAKGA